MERVSGCLDDLLCRDAARLGALGLALLLLAGSVLFFLSWHVIRRQERLLRRWDDRLNRPEPIDAEGEPSVMVRSDASSGARDAA